MQALTLVQCFFHPALQIGDAQIVHANDQAAELYGFASAAALVGRFVSDLQVPSSRAAGRARWALRHEGGEVAPDYTTLVRRPDGEVVGHRGTLVSQMAGLHGESYLTALELVSELDEPSIPDLDQAGITPAQAEQHTGRYTVADVRSMLADGTWALQHGETFPTIVSRYDAVSNAKHGHDIGCDADSMSALDSLLRGPGTFTLSDKAHTQIFFRHHCQRCGRQWDGRKPVKYQCPSCRYKFPQADRQTGRTGG